MARVLLLCGSRRSQRTAALLELMRPRWERAILLVPTRRLAQRLAERIVLEWDLPGMWGRRVLTFQDFVHSILVDSGLTLAPINEMERRLILQGVIARLRAGGRLERLGKAAETPGFLSHVERIIAALKQAAVEPRSFRALAKTRPHASWIDGIVSDIYEAYQERLIQARAYDRQGLYWEANRVCQQQRPPVLADVDTLLLDAFDDFTPTELRLLKALVPYLDGLVFGLNCPVKEPGRRDLFGIAGDSADTLIQTFDAALTTFDEPAPQTLTEFAERHIFWRDKPPCARGLLRNLEIIPCAGVLHELETIARRIKTLLVNHEASADEIVVVYRDVAAMAETVRGIFGEFGIPVRVLAAPKLAESSIAQFLSAFLEGGEDWGRESVMDVLVSPWFGAGAPPDCVAAFPTLARLAMITRGRTEWKTRLENLIAHLTLPTDEETETLLARMPVARDAARAMLTRVQRYADMLEAVPSRGELKGYVAVLDRLLSELDVAGSVASHPCERIREVEGAALDTLRDVLGRMERWDRSVGAVGPLTRGEFLARFREILQDTPFPYPEQAGAGILCADAESVRHVRFDYVFFAGVNEGEAPKPPAVSAVYGEQDICELAVKGIALESNSVRTAREMLLFHYVLGVPRKHLYLTWHTRTLDGKEAHPSPFIDDVLGLFAGVEPPVQQSIPHPLSFVPEPHEIASLRDLRNAAFSTAPALAEVFSDALGRARHGADIEQSRHDETPFGAYDGVLTSAGGSRLAAERFDGQHLFSVRQFETYAACPFRFFVEQFLKIFEAETPTMEFDNRLRGLIVHEVLQQFHQRHSGVALPDISFEEALRTLRSVAAGVFGDRAERANAAPKGVLEVEKRRLDNMLERYLRLEREQGESEWKPTYFEVSFGQVHGEPRGPLSRSEPFPLDISSEKVLLSGRIDRVDISDDGARLLDYKTGGAPSAKDVKTGHSLQLQLYSLAIEQFLLPGTRCTQALFLPVGREERVVFKAEKEEEWRQAQTAALDQAGQCVAGMRAGHFPPKPIETACRFCRIRRACRYERGRVARKTSKQSGSD